MSKGYALKFFKIPQTPVGMPTVRENPETTVSLFLTNESNLCINKQERSNATPMKEIPESAQKTPFHHITGVILAGGKSKRYGQNKAFIEINGMRLIDHIAENMRAIFNRVILVANEKTDYEYLGLPIFQDLIKGLGPFGGIYTGLMSISESAGFFVPCDMPFINPPLIRYMVSIKDSYTAIVPSFANDIEPLFAIYDKSCCDLIKNLIDSQHYQIRLFYDQVSVRYVMEKEITKFGSPENLFHNINTPEEHAKIRSLAES